MKKPAEPSTPSGPPIREKKATDHELRKHDKFTRYGQASCGQEARLFFHASTSGDASEMVDQEGRAYTSLPTAFLHRKRIVAGCRCRPEPWSEAELSRHRLYAFNEARERLRQEHAQPEMAADRRPRSSPASP